MKKTCELPGIRGVPATCRAECSMGLPARPTAGFTLIEVLIVVIIMTILLGFAIPGFTRWLPNYRLRGAARDLFSNLQLAKAGAIKERSEWAVVFNPTANEYRVISGGADRTYSTTGDNVLQKTVALTEYGSGVSFGTGSSSPPVVASEVVASASDPVVFNSRGFTTGTNPVTAYLTNDRSTSYAVGTWASGAVVLRKWNGAWQ